MQPVDWGEAFRIVVSGLVVVFAIMTLLAVATHYMGKIVQAANKKKKAQAAAQAEASK